VTRWVAGFAAAVAIVTAGSSAAATPSANGPCSWSAESNPDAVNIAFPDEGATYWGTQTVSIPSTGLVIRGRFPHARYFSLHAYDPALRPVGSLYDTQIDPSSGVNPYRRPGDPTKAAPVDGSYVVRILPTAPPAKPEPNTIYMGATHEGAPNPQGIVLYRVYVADDPRDPTGGVGLPDVSMQVGDGAAEVPFGQCDITGQLPDTGLNKTIRESSYPSGVSFPIAAKADTSPPNWEKFFGYSTVVKGVAGDNAATQQVPSGGGFLSNQQNDYIGTGINRKYGSVVVFRMRMPTFPDTRAGEPAWLPRQVRYWSICQNEPFTQRYVACVGDADAVLGQDGYGTFVISDPADRPANADRAHGVNWLPWGGTYPDGRIIYRQMVPAPDFTQAFAPITPDEDLRTALGAYYPVTAYCTKARFEQGGAAACLS
jgi:hypothetical protein